MQKDKNKGTKMVTKDNVNFKRICKADYFTLEVNCR